MIHTHLIKTKTKKEQAHTTAVRHKHACPPGPVNLGAVPFRYRGVSGSCSHFYLGGMAHLHPAKSLGWHTFDSQDRRIWKIFGANARLRHFERLGACLLVSRAQLEASAIMAFLQPRDWTRSILPSVCHFSDMAGPAACACVQADSICRRRGRADYSL
jgi:hypothetical protein